MTKKRKKQTVNPRTLALFRIGGMIATCKDLNEQYPDCLIELGVAVAAFKGAIKKIKEL